MFPSLQDFVTALEQAGELRRVEAPVSSILEIAEISHRMARLPAPSAGVTGHLVDPERPALGGPALLFTNVTESDANIPVAINLFGSYRRMEMALGCHEEGHTPGGFESIASRIASLTKPTPPAGLGEIIEKAREFLALLRIPPKTVRRGACQEVVRTGDDVNLFDLPLIKCWPLDGDIEAVGYPVPTGQPDTSAGMGRYITLAGMYTIHADDEGKKKPPSRNIGMYRAQLLDRTHLAMHWHVHHDGARHWRSWKRAGKPMPIAIALGGESVLPYGATAPLPPGISELLMAGFLNRGPIKLVKCKTVPLHVPANAEIVIEGYVSTDAGFVDYDPRHTDEPIGPGAVFEGPFGDHTGFYSLPDRYPIVDVTAITRRRDAIYPTTIVGPPPQEDYYLGKATERIFLPLLKTLVHDIVDYDLPLFGCFHNCAVIQIEKEYALQARRVMHAIWGAGQMAWTKIIIVVDDSVDVHNLDAVLRAVFEHCQFERDIELVNGPLDILDHAAPGLGAGHKIGFDATSRFVGEDVHGIPIDAPFETVAAQSLDELKAIAGVDRVEVPAFGDGRCAFIRFDDRAITGQQIRSHLKTIVQSFAYEFVIAVGPDVDVRDRDTVLFHWAANSDPGRDMIRHQGRVAFDATPKEPGRTENGHAIRPFPPYNRMSDEIVERVTARWDEYGFGDVK